MAHLELQFPDLRPLGQDHHNGYGGQGTAFVNANIEAWMTSSNPDIILLMIGINDIGKGSSGEPTTAENNLNGIVQKVITAKPLTYLIIAQITPYTASTPSIINYNNYIKNTLVPSYANRGCRVFTVNQFANFASSGSAGDSSLYANGINHPNATGYNLMAQTWYDGLFSSGALPQPTALQN